MLFVQGYGKITCFLRFASLCVFVFVRCVKYPMDDLVPGPNELLIVKKPNQTTQGSQQVRLSDGRLPDATRDYSEHPVQNSSHKHHEISETPEKAWLNYS